MSLESYSLATCMWREYEGIYSPMNLLGKKEINQNNFNVLLLMEKCVRVYNLILCKYVIKTCHMPHCKYDN